MKFWIVLFFILVSLRVMSQDSFFSNQETQSNSGMTQEMP